tara:strand:- start:4787 stop:5092 length:306 start_codon:yes stop_codon:yes gene_type:complete
MATEKIIVDGNIIEVDENDARHSTQHGYTQSQIETQLAEELAIEVRSERDRLLIETDWTQGRDVVLSNDAKWKTYRQALRDLPTHSNWPDLKDEDWPTKPS